MPNIVAPSGFSPSRYLNGSAYNGAMNLYYIPAADGSIFSVGDAVMTAAGADANGIPAVAKATGTSAIRGVIQGVLVTAPGTQTLEATAMDLTRQNIPAAKAKDYYVMVVDDPDVLFSVQDDGLAALTAAAANKNATFTVANPSGAAQVSASVLSTASITALATGNLKLFGLLQRPNNAFGANATWLVKFNQHELQGNTAGV